MEELIGEYRGKLQQIDKLLIEATEQDNEKRVEELAELKKELKDNLMK